MFLTNIYSIDYVKFKLGCLNPGFYKSRIVYTFTCFYTRDTIIYLYH